MSIYSADVLVVGGGPAGSTCAWKLRQAGLNVLVLDKACFPRDKTCAGWITPAVVESLQLDANEYRLENVWQPIQGFRCGVIGGGSVNVDYASTISFGIRRREFDNYLLTRAGVPTRHARVDSLEHDGKAWTINHEFSAPMLVGAGGNFCPVAKLLGGPQRESPNLVVAQEVEFAIPAAHLDRVNVDPQRPELYFCQDLRGYGWCFRKQGFLNIGLGRVDAKNLSAHVAGFCEFLKATERVSCELPPRFHGHAYRLYDAACSPLFADGVLLVGDSAGLAYPQSGEGIRPAVESGLMAADVILAAAGDYQSHRLAKYTQQIQARFGEQSRHSSFNMLLINFLPAHWLAYVASKLLTTAWFSRRVVMDQWFLHSELEAMQP